MLKLKNCSIFIPGINTAADVANLVAKAFSNNNNNNNNRNKPDLFSIIQKGLQSSLSQNSQETKYSEKQQQADEEDESDQQQTEESKQFQTKSTSTPAKENVGVNFSTANLITSMLRMVGFDASKLGALAINALIMIASAVMFYN